MAIYRYTKSNNVETREHNYMEIIPEEPKVLNEANLWNSMADGYETLQTMSSRSRLANFIIPGIFITLGVSLILQQIIPEIRYQIEQTNGSVSQGVSSPVSDQYIDLSQYISKPAGLDQLAQEAFEQNILQEDTVSKNYQGVFYISIPALNMKDLPIKANVDSTNEASYMPVLETSLAHFQNTGLPISDVKNNIVIYGHSASPSYNPQPENVEVAFSFLRNLKVGDDIYITIEGKTHHYKMSRSKVVEPTDLSIITGELGKRTLTLFTCDPPGNNAYRYVAIAREIT